MRLPGGRRAPVEAVEVSTGHPCASDAAPPPAVATAPAPADATEPAAADATEPIAADATEPAPAPASVALAPAAPAQAPAQPAAAQPAVAQSPAAPSPAQPAIPPHRALPASVVSRNVQLMYRDALAMGVVAASTPFLPVLLLRLGGTSLQVSLLAAMPAITGFLFAIPLGRMLQRRRTVIPWYSRGRLLAQSSFAVIAGVILLVPAGPPGAGSAAAIAVLVVWAAQTLPNTVGNVTFPVVMDGLGGPSRRFDLLARRWMIMGITTALVVAGAGQVLGLLPPPANYAVVFAAFSVAGVVSWWYARRFRLPEQEPPPTPVADATPRLRLAAFARVVRAEPRFLTFEVRSFLYTACVYMAAPLMPLYYVEAAHASDAWIGIIGACAAGTQLLGFWGWRRVSLRLGSRPVVLATVLGYALVPGILTLVGALPAIAVLAGTGAVFYAGASLMLFDELMRRVPPRYAVSFTAIDQSVQNLAATIAPVIGGIVATVLGISQGLLVAAAFGLGSFALFALEGRGIGRRVVKRVRTARGRRAIA